MPPTAQQATPWTPESVGAASCRVRSRPVRCRGGLLTFVDQFADSDDPFRDTQGSAYKPYQTTNESSFTVNTAADPFSDRAAANEYGGSATSAGGSTGFGPAPVTAEELSRREAQLRAQEDALRQRQEDLSRREADLGIQQNNWPPCSCTD